MLKIINRIKVSTNNYGFNRFSQHFLRKKHVWNTERVVASPFKDIVVPEGNLNDYIWRNLDKWATKTATVCAITRRGYTYEQLYKQTQNFAANLRKKFNIQDGDTVAVILPNMPEYPAVVLGIQAAGGVITPMNPNNTAFEVKRQILMSDAKVIVIHPDIAPTIKEALHLCEKDIPVVAVNMTEGLPERTVSYKELVEDSIDLSILRGIKRDSKDVAFLPYSSGTTGLPKGVELTNRNVLANFEQQNTECRCYSYTTETNQDPCLSILPMFHAYGLFIITMHKLTVGLKIVTLPRFKPETFLNALLEYKIRLLYLAPPMGKYGALACMDMLTTIFPDVAVLFLGSSPQATRKHLEHVRYCLSGAAPLPEPDIQNFLNKIGSDVYFGQGYGLTETGPLAAISPIGFINRKSVGFPLPNMQMRVVDGELNNLGPNEMGEILIKGPNVMKGYKNNPEANREVLLEGGWFRSGDLGMIDESGAVTIADRLKELIKVNAMQVPPAELESVIKEHPAVLDAAVIGIPDPKTGERPKAFVVLNKGVKCTAENVMEFVSGRVAPYKRIKEVMFIDSVPKNPSGKILRRVIKDQYCTEK